VILYGITLFGAFLTFVSENLIEDVSRKQSDMLGRASLGHFRIVAKDIETTNTFGYYHYDSAGRTLTVDVIHHPLFALFGKEAIDHDGDIDQSQGQQGPGHIHDQKFPGEEPLRTQDESQGRRRDPDGTQPRRAPP